MAHKRRTKKITVTFTAPALTGKKVHSVTITDTSLYDTWDCVTIGKAGKRLQKAGCEATHDINLWSDGIGDFDPLQVALYKLHVERGVVSADTSNWTNCEVLSVSGDRKIVKKEIDGKIVFGYQNNLVDE